MQVMIAVMALAIVAILLVVSFTDTTNTAQTRGGYGAPPPYVPPPTPTPTPAPAPAPEGGDGDEGEDAEPELEGEIEGDLEGDDGDLEGDADGDGDGDAEALKEAIRKLNQARKFAAANTLKRAFIRHQKMLKALKFKPAGTKPKPTKFMVGSSQAKMIVQATGGKAVKFTTACCPAKRPLLNTVNKTCVKKCPRGMIKRNNTCVMPTSAMIGRRDLDDAPTGSTCTPITNAFFGNLSGNKPQASSRR